MSAEEEEARRIAEMGKPILGEHSRLEVVIEESYEFKVNLKPLISRCSWCGCSAVGVTPASSTGWNCFLLSGITTPNFVSGKKKTKLTNN